ncbi:MAG TPA: hypothetical protein VGK51_17825 [Actinomycetota bacterium]
MSLELAVHVALAATPLLEHLHQAAGTTAALRSLRLQPVDEQVDGTFRLAVRRLKTFFV